MIQFRTQGKIAKAQLAESATDQTTIISNLADANLELRQEVEKLAAQQQEYQRSRDQGGLTDMVADVNRLRVFTGQSEVTGPGVELRIAANLQPENVEDLINELRNAGAEAIAISGERIAVNSAVTSYQGKVVINGTLVQSPFVFQAIGQPDTLDRALGRKGGMVSYLRTAYPSGEVTLVKQSSMTLPMYRGTLRLQNAQPVR
jgi:uncharacterized protein YlxW (UPF0749 family)